ncbi:MAG: hypothetical protein H6519_00785 [Microthrixaceae bacterium]|nr:hypothetical protein [Acidimicrobiales bacterium]MCB9402951.1 hypothetical protein [Microthrixaceae bacterium]
MAWNMYQELNIQRSRGQAAVDIQNRDNLSGRQQDRIDDLEERVDRLLLLTESMWELLSKHLGFTDEHLVHMVRTLDLSDGQLDNKVNRPARKCQNCQSAVPKDRATCQFCGTEVPGANLFDA